MLEGARKFSFPAGLLDGDPDSVMLCIPVPLVPYFRRFFSQVESPYVWKTAADFERAYPIFAEIEAQMAGTCASEMIASIDRLYRLIDVSLNGTQYTAVGGVITPAIPAVPANEVGLSPGLRRQLLDMQGVINAGWFGIGGEPATIADIVNALRVGSEEKKQSLLDKLSQILGAGSDAATIFNLVEDLLADSIDATEEGGMIATLLASTMAQAALMGAQAAQLDDLIASVQRLVHSLDGGANPAPATNVIAELQAANTLLG